MKKPTVKSLQKELASVQETLRAAFAQRDQAKSEKWTAEDAQRKTEVAAREERRDLQAKMDDLHERLERSDQAGQHYQNKVLIYFMALANPEVSKDAEHMKMLMSAIVTPYSAHCLSPKDFLR